MPRSKPGLEKVDNRNYVASAKKLVDLDTFHKYLWEHTDHTGKLLVTATKMGEEMGLYHMAMSRLMKAMEIQGRINKLHKSLVFVINPETWVDSDGHSGSGPS